MGLFRQHPLLVLPLSAAELYVPSNNPPTEVSPEISSSGLRLTCKKQRRFSCSHSFQMETRTLRRKACAMGHSAANPGLCFQSQNSSEITFAQLSDLRRACRQKSRPPHMATKNRSLMVLRLQVPGLDMKTNICASPWPALSLLGDGQLTAASWSSQAANLKKRNKTTHLRSWSSLHSICWQNKLAYLHWQA